MIFINRKPKEAEEPSLFEIADKDIASEQTRYKEFVVRPESRGTTAVSGLNGIRYIADFKELSSEKERVRYQFSFISPARGYEIRFETGKENFERLRPDFDSILSSLRVE
jgi:hypothetical protein